MIESWKKVVVSLLRRYDANCRAAENLKRELRQNPFKDKVDDPWSVYSQDRRQLRKRLRQIQAMKMQVENALATLTPQDRILLQMLDIAPAKGNGEKLCQMLGCEIATVYRRRNKALRKFAEAMFGA